MKRVKIFVAAIAALMIAVNVNAQDVNELIEQFNAAAELLNQKQYVEGAKALESVIRDAAEFEEDGAEVSTNAKKLVAASYFRAGMSDAKDKNYDAAVENFNKAITTGQKYGDSKSVNDSKTRIGQVYSVMGADAFNNKDYAKAIEIFSKGYEVNPNDTKLALNLAMSYCESGDMEKGFEIYENIIELGQQHSKYAEAAATAEEKLAYYKTFDISKAIEAKDYAKANQMMDDILKEDPENDLVNLLMIQTANIQQNWSKIISRGPAAANAQKNGVRKSDVNFYIGVAYQNTGNNPKAIEFYRKVTEGNNVATAKTQITELSK